MGVTQMRGVLGLVAFLSATGCASGRSGDPKLADAVEAERAAASTDTAAAIYALAEARYAEGDYPRAADLMRRALLQLPETASADDQRHAILMRLGHTQMRAWLLTGDPGFLLDAQSMLSRYAAVHPEIFGEDEARALQTRDELYALLGEVELRLDEPERMAKADGAAEVVAHRKRAAGNREAPKIDTHAGEALEEEMTRKINIKRARLASGSSARARQRLRSDFATADAGLVLTRPGGGDALHGPRGLVRVLKVRGVADTPHPKADHGLSRRLGLALVRSARPALRRCYEDALGRRSAMLTDSTVELSVRPDGALARVRIVEGQLVDAGGDVCLLDSLEGQQIAEPPPAEVRLQVSLQFFFQNAHYPDGHPSDKHREQPRNPVFDPAAPLETTPGIDSFSKEKGQL